MVTAGGHRRHTSAQGTAGAGSETGWSLPAATDGTRQLRGQPGPGQRRDGHCRRPQTAHVSSGDSRGRVRDGMVTAGGHRRQASAQGTAGAGSETGWSLPAATDGTRQLRGQPGPGQRRDGHCRRPQTSDGSSGDSRGRVRDGMVTAGGHRRQTAAQGTAGAGSETGWSLPAATDVRRQLRGQPGPGQRRDGHCRRPQTADGSSGDSRGRVRDGMVTAGGHRRQTAAQGTAGAGSETGWSLPAATDGRRQLRGQPGPGQRRDGHCRRPQTADGSSGDSRGRVRDGMVTAGGHRRQTAAQGGGIIGPESGNREKENNVSQPEAHVKPHT